MMRKSLYRFFGFFLFCIFFLKNARESSYAMDARAFCHGAAPSWYAFCRSAGKRSAFAFFFSASLNPCIAN